MGTRKPRVAQHLFEQEIMKLNNKGEALQNDYNRLRTTLAALTRKAGTIHLTKADMAATMEELANDTKKMRVTQHPEGDGLILSFEGAAPLAQIAKVAKLSRWERLKAWFSLWAASKGHA